MGSDAHVLVVADDHENGDELLDVAENRIAELEQRWSRFIADSEVSVLNRGEGGPAVVSADTALLVDRCVAAWWATHGRFDPTVHDAVVANGYDRDFSEIPSLAAPPEDARRAPGLHGVVVDRDTGLVWLPAGVRIDPGGIGKGLAADLVVDELLSQGATGACVNLGGDLRVEGTPPAGDVWTVSVDHPLIEGEELARLGLRAGAVATSSRLKRRWRAGTTELHHLVHPSTGLPADTPIVAATAIAKRGWKAEVAAKHALLAEPGEELAPIGGASVVTIDRNGRCARTSDLEGVLAS
jgi:thiamine biosynthesis lipoprotein